MAVRSAQKAGAAECRRVIRQTTSRGRFRSGVDVHDAVVLPSERPVPLDRILSMTDDERIPRWRIRYDVLRQQHREMYDSILAFVTRLVNLSLYQARVYQGVKQSSNRPAPGSKFCRPVRPVSAR